MRAQGVTGGQWVIARDQRPVRYFSFYVDSRPSWTKLLNAAMKFDKKVQAELYIRDMSRSGREKYSSVMSPHGYGRPREEYMWTKTDKKLLVQMFAMGCKPAAMAAQFDRTTAACRSMYNLILNRGTL